MLGMTRKYKWTNLICETLGKCSSFMFFSLWFNTDCVSFKFYYNSSLKI